MFFGWEFGNSASAGLGLKAITSPNFSRQELASRPLKETSRLSRGPTARAFCSAQGSLLVEGGCFPGPGAGPVPTF